MVNSLTLSKIIKLHTSIKDAPSNVFFSSKFCKDAINNKCLRQSGNDPKVMVEYLKNGKDEKDELLHTLRSKNSTLQAMSIIFGAIVVLIVVIAGFMTLKRRSKKSSSKRSNGRDDRIAEA